MNMVLANTIADSSRIYNMGDEDPKYPLLVLATFIHNCSFICCPCRPRYLEPMPQTNLKLLEQFYEL